MKENGSEKYLKISLKKFEKQDYNWSKVKFLYGYIY